MDDQKTSAQAEDGEISRVSRGCVSLPCRRRERFVVFSPKNKRDGVGILPNVERVCSLHIVFR